MMWFAMASAVVLVVGIVVVSRKQIEDVIRNQQFKQPAKSQKTDLHVCCQTRIWEDPPFDPLFFTFRVAGGKIHSTPSLFPVDKDVCEDRCK